MTMLDRIEMNVIDVALEIPVVLNRMFPESTLPDATFAFLLTAARYRLSYRQNARKVRFDQPPPSREIVIPVRERPNGMDMIGQHDDCIGCERMATTGVGERAAQCIDVIDEQT